LQSFKPFGCAAPQEQNREVLEWATGLSQAGFKASTGTISGQCWHRLFALDQRHILGCTILSSARACPRCRSRCRSSIISRKFPNTKRTASGCAQSPMSVAPRVRGHGHEGWTEVSDVNVALFLSASESAAAPAAPTWLLSRLQRGEEGQGCSWRDSAAGIEQGAHDYVQAERGRQQSVEMFRSVVLSGGRRFAPLRIARSSRAT
jgi:hypothetical protein